MTGAAGRRGFEQNIIVVDLATCDNGTVPNSYSTVRSASRTTTVVRQGYEYDANIDYSYCTRTSSDCRLSVNPCSCEEQVLVKSCKKGAGSVLQQDLEEQKRFESSSRFSPARTAVSVESMLTACACCVLQYNTNMSVGSALPDLVIII